jgi:hypothetical protein
VVTTVALPLPLPHAEQLTSANFTEGNNREFGLMHINSSSLLVSPHLELTMQLIKREIYIESDYTCAHLRKLHVLQFDTFNEAVGTAKVLPYRTKYVRNYARERRGKMRCDYAGPCNRFV